jgi:prolipoprotein diacylglyceryltransferase
MIQNPDIAHTVHYALEWIALATGFAVYRAGRLRRGEPGLTAPGSFIIVVCCLLGAGLGNKLASFANDHVPVRVLLTDLRPWLDGQSIVGALLGGWLGVELGKRLAGRSDRTGDGYVVPILIGIAIGRVGCFLAGLHDGTCGLPTDLPWGVDFGDGLARHPTQLYESLLALAAAVTWPRWRKLFARTPGLGFRIFMLGYLLWRVGIDTLKPMPHAYAFGLSGIQWISVAGILAILVGFVCDRRRVPSCR